MSLLQKIGFVFGCVILTLLVFFITLDKQKLFWTLQEKLSHQGVIIEPNELKSKWLGIEMKGLNLYYNKSLVANTQTMQINLIGINMTKITFENLLHQVIPFKVSEINYSFFTPLTINFLGDMGEGQINYDISKNSLFIKLQPTKAMKESKNMRYFKESNGVMIYEYNL